MPISEEHELDFDLVEVPSLSPEEEQRIRIQASIFRKSLVCGADPKFQQIVNNLSDFDVVELYNGRNDQLMIAMVHSERRVFDVEPPKQKTVTTSISARKKIKVRETDSTVVASADENVIEVHKLASDFLKDLLREDPSRIVVCE